MYKVAIIRGSRKPVEYIERDRLFEKQDELKNDWGSREIILEVQNGLRNIKAHGEIDQIIHVSPCDPLAG